MKTKKKMLAALAALILGAIALPGCYIGPWWGGPYHEGWEEHEGHWDRHERGRRGELTPHEDQQRHNNYARHVHDGRDVG